MIYGKRVKTRVNLNGQILPEPNNTIAIAYKTNEWVLVDYEVIETSDFVNYGNLNEIIKDYPKSRVAILCTLKNIASN